MSDRTNVFIPTEAVSAVVRQRPHGNLEPRGLEPAAITGGGGRFGRMFGLKPLKANPKDLEFLGSPAPTGSGLMVDSGAVGDSAVPAGFTYLGQFIDHDITFDPASSLDKQNDPHALRNFRSPRLDLDSLYMGGPSDCPFLYDSTPGKNDLFLLGPSTNTGQFSHPKLDAAGDLPRNSQNVGLIGDPRNDENLVVAQLHRQFLKFHNRVVDWAHGQGVADSVLFLASQQLVRWHYQWIVLNDYLPRIVGPKIVQEVFKTGRRFFKFKKNEPFMPVEFSVAAFRFGHSMVRDSYPRFQQSPRPFTSASLSQLFQFTHQNVTAVSWILHPDDWQNLFETKSGVTPVVARAFDTRLAATLSHLPNLPSGATPTALAARNLLRGHSFALPSGQAVANLMKKKVSHIVPLSEKEISDLDPSGFLGKSKLAADTPLWFYILAESQIREGGARLGAVGGRIVAEVLIGLAQGDPNSFLNAGVAAAQKSRAATIRSAAPRQFSALIDESRRAAAQLGADNKRARGIGSSKGRAAASTAWVPVLPSLVSGQFTMADLIMFANS